jgi:hypothetical protein
MPTASSCPNCASRIEILSVASGTPTTCPGWGEPFVVRDVVPPKERNNTAWRILKGVSLVCLILVMAPVGALISAFLCFIHPTIVDDA